MHEEIAIGGLGGQGVLFIGRLLAEAAFREGREVVWMPSYAAEKRGGNVWCNVIISDEKIGAIFIARPMVAVAMSPAALVKFESTMKPEGLLVVNQSLVLSPVSREDIRVLYMPVSAAAAELGDDSVGNLIILGALVAGCPVVSMAGLTTVLDGILSKDQVRLEMNKRALHKGYSQV